MLIFTNMATVQRDLLLLFIENQRLEEISSLLFRHGLGEYIFLQQLLVQEMVDVLVQLGAPY